MFNKLNPLIAGSGVQNDPSLKEDFKKSVRVEKFRIGEKAVYIPAGFSWKYLLKKDIETIIKGKWLRHGLRRPRPSGSGTGQERKFLNWKRKRVR